MKMEFSKQCPHIYFIGIGGISMSGLAEILWSKGFQVSGTDIKETTVTQHLCNLGIQVNIGHKKENITDDIDLVVYTAAVKNDNPELEAAREKGIQIIDRAQLLGRIMADYSNSIAVSGTHGKTTTTSMVAEILLGADTDPTITVGGILPSIHSNTKVGASPYFVAEACEYCDSFLRFNPKVAIILNVEADHLDYFKNLENIRKSFHAFAGRVPDDGIVIINGEIDRADELTAGLCCRVERFGLEQDDAQWKAENIVHEDNGKNSFDVSYNNQHIGRIHLNVPGDHNISNALAACAAAYALDISMEDIQKGLENYHGTDRRFQYKGVKNGVTVIDDYAHHPTEIKAALSAAQKIKHRHIWCVFQPHTYTRTKFLFEEFSQSFQNADHVIIADIYAARENDTGLVSAAQLADRIALKGQDAVYAGDFDNIAQYLKEHCQDGDLLLTIGAGDVYRIGEQFLTL